MQRTATPTAVTLVLILLVLIAAGIGIPFLFGAHTSGFEPAELSAVAALAPGWSPLG